MSKGTPCMWMRGGTSKGGYFLKDDLPNEVAARDAFLLRVMGSPDPRQIDGMGGADPLTSKVAIVSVSQRQDVDLDYLFLQVFVDEAIVTDAQNCGNILAGIGPFAIERGLVTPTSGETRIAIFMENTGQIAVATVQTPNGQLTYAGDATISGVPGTAAPIPLSFRDTAGSSCGALLPTGNNVDEIDGIKVTLIDNGMPCVVLSASDVGITGYEDRELIRDREVLSRIVAEVAGETVAAANTTEKTKTLKRIVRDHLDGADGRPKAERWMPKWLSFPASAYTSRGGVGTVAAHAKVEAARVPAPDPEDDQEPFAEAA